MTLSQSLLFLTLFFYKDIELNPIVIISLFYTFIKLEILLAIVLFLSTFMSNMLSIIITFISYIIWSSFSIIQDLVTRSWNEVSIFLTRCLWIIFPPFESLNLKDFIWWVLDISSMYYLTNTIYSLWYLSIILFLTVILFNNKKFEI